MSTLFIKQLTYIYKLSLEAEYLKIIVARAPEMKTLNMHIAIRLITGTWAN